MLVATSLFAGAMYVGASTVSAGATTDTDVADPARTQGTMTLPAPVPALSSESSTYDTQLAAAGSLSGTVTGSDLSLLEGVYVELYDAAYDWVDSTTTDTAGTYSFPAIDADAVKIRFYASDGYASEWFDDAADFDSAALVDTSAGTAAIADAVLAAPGVVEGVVSLEGGGFSVGTTVVLNSVGCCSYFNTTTDESGAYSFPVVPAGEYTVFFHAPAGTNYVPEYWENASYFSNAGSIVVASGATTTADVELTLGGSINGRVTDDAGSGVEGVQVRMEDITYGGWFYAYTDADGYYSYPGLYPSSYDTRFNPPAGFLEQRYFAYVGVRSGEDTIGIDAVLERAGIVTGQVVDPDGFPIQNAFISFEGQENTGFGYAYDYTDSSGNFTAGGLVPGVYVVRASATDFLAEYWDDQPDYANADLVAVPADTVTSGIDFVLAPIPDATGSISGTVTDQDGFPIPNAEVYTSGRWVTTDIEGRYTLSNLVDDDYVVEAAAAGYVSEYYLDAYDYIDATPVTVSGGLATVGIDLRLDEAASISGTVTTVDGLAPSYLRVFAQPVGGSKRYYASYSSATGKYDIDGLPPAEYSVKFEPYQPSPYLEQYYGGGVVAPGTAVAAAAGDEIVGIDAHLILGGIVTGTVTNEAGDPIPNVRVSLQGPEYDDILTDTNGDYTLRGLQAGSYVAYFDPPSDSDYLDEYFDDQPSSATADDVVVALGVETPGIDAVLGTGVSISGTITDPNGDPVAGVSVQTLSGPSSDGTSTDVDGSYELTGLRPGDYCVQVPDSGVPTGLLGEIYGPDPDQCLPESKLTVTEPLTGIDIQLDPAPTMSGRVTDEAGDPIEGAKIGVGYIWWSETYRLSAVTDSNGDYTLVGRIGYEKVRFDGPEGAGYVSEYYDDSIQEWSAENVTAGRGDTLTGYDAALAVGATLRGTVTDESGAPVVNGYVNVSGPLSVSMQTDETGGYEFDGLAAGEYVLNFSPPAGSNLVGEYHLDALDYNDATPLQLAAGDDITIDATLATGATISGTVTGVGVGPLGGASVYAYRPMNNGYSFVSSATTAEDGSYTIIGLPAVDISILVNAPYQSEFASEWYDGDATTFETSTPIPLTAATDVTGIDVELGLLGSVSGTITDASGPLEGANVTIGRVGDPFLCWDCSFSVTTEADGTYSIASVPPGDYRAWIGRPSSRPDLASEYFDDAYRYADATIVEVGFGASVVIDEQLEAGGVVEGRVTDPSGNGVAEAYVSLDPGGWTYTDENGDYRIEGVAPVPSTLLVNAWSTPYVIEWYDDAHTLADATEIVPVLGETTVIDVQLDLGGSISGTVTDGAGAPIGGVCVNVDTYQTNDEAGCLGWTDETGHYTIGRLLASDYAVCFSGVEYAPECHEDQVGPGSGDRVPVVAGEDTVVDAVLGLGGSLSVTVVDGAAPAPAGMVFVDDPNGIPGAFGWWIDWQVTVAYQYTDTQPWSFPHLHPGEYIVRYESYDGAKEASGRVTIVDGELSELQLTVGATGPVVPSAPGAPTAVAGDTEAALSWTAPTDTGGSAITDYVIEYREVGAPGWSTFDNGTSTGTSTTVTGLTNGVAYEFRVSAVNSVGTGSPSSASAPATPIEPTTVPGAPGTPSGTAGSGQVSLSWAAPTDDGGAPVTDYVVQYKAASDAAWTTFSDGVSSSPSTTVTGLANGTAYVFRVAAVNGEGTGTFSGASAQLTPVAPVVTTTPSAPGKPLATPDTKRVLLSWGAPASDGGLAITDYVVEFKTLDAVSWSRFDDGVSTARSATVDGLTNGVAYVFRVAAVNGVGVGAFSPTSDGAVPIAPTPTEPPQLGSVVPARLLETRSGPGLSTVDGLHYGGGRAAAGSVTEFLVAGRGGVDKSATAVMLNIIAIRPETAGFLTVFPCGEQVPNASSVNFETRQVVPNAVLAKIGAGGKVCIYSTSETDLVADVNGYVPIDGSPMPVVPGRLLETRSGPGMSTVDGRFLGAGRVAAGSVTEIEVAGRGGVADDAAAVILNVTAIRPSKEGYLTVFPCGVDVPNASSVNYQSGQVVPNAVLAKIGTGGKVCIFSLQETHLVVDVNAFVPNGGSPTPVSPVRLLETRTGPDLSTIDGKYYGAGRVAAGSITEFEVAGRGGVDGDASAVMLNIIAIRPSGPGYLTVFPCGEQVPNASSVNFRGGDVVPNAVLAKVGAGGKVCIFSTHETHLVADVNGFVPG